VSRAADVRNAAWWAVSPVAYATAQVARQSGMKVLAGPFAGMRYPMTFVPRMLFHGPYQVGSFEFELHPALERIIASRPAAVVNVGSAEGYYTTGLAMRLPQARVLGFEDDPRLRAAADELGRLNGVGDRIDLRGHCAMRDLAALGSQLGDGQPAVIIDCEGCEGALVDPAAVPWLARAMLLVELHPAVDPAIAETLSKRLEPTHEVEPVASGIRRASDLDHHLRPLRGLRRIDRELLVAEFRDGPQDWLCAWPRDAASSPREAAS
jgi:hypothetical protein